MTKDEHRINRDREPDPEEGEVCEDCGRVFLDEERFQRHREREKRETLRGSAVGEAILRYDSTYRRR